MACVRMLREIARLNSISLGRRMDVLEYGYVPHQRDTGATCGRMLAADGDGGRMGGRLQYVLAMARYRHKQKRQRSV